jgi:hypothetical protein
MRSNESPTSSSWSKSNASPYREGDVGPRPSLDQPELPATPGPDGRSAALWDQWLQAQPDDPGEFDHRLGGAVLDGRAGRTA